MEMDMIHDIGTGIVTFLLGAALTYVLEKWTGAFRRLGAMEFALQALLRNRMIQTVNYYREKQKPVPQWELECFDQMHDAGKGLGVDGYFDELKKVMHEELRHETH